MLFIHVQNSAQTLRRILRSLRQMAVPHAPIQTEQECIRNQ
jgi:hypothetical protein